MHTKALVNDEHALKSIIFDTIFAENTLKASVLGYKINFFSSLQADHPDRL